MLANSISQSVPSHFGMQDQVHVWCARLDQPHAVLQEFTRTLSPEEQSRAARFAFAHDRRRFIARRGILRAILGRYVDIAPGHLEFETGVSTIVKRNIQPLAESLTLRTSLATGCKLLAWIPFLTSTVII